MFSTKLWLLFLGLLAVASFTLAQDYDGDDDGDDFFSGGSDDDDDFAAASGTPGQSTGADDASGASYGPASSYGGSSYGSDAGGAAGALGSLGLGASPFAGASLPSLYGAYGAASNPKVKVLMAPKRNDQLTILPKLTA